MGKGSDSNVSCKLDSITKKGKSKDFKKKIYHIFKKFNILGFMLGLLTYLYLDKFKE